MCPGILNDVRSFDYTYMNDFSRHQIITSSYISVRTMFDQHKDIFRTRRGMKSVLSMTLLKERKGGGREKKKGENGREWEIRWRKRSQ